MVWINSANIFDAGAGFGGFRESGFGREGGREGMRAYLRHAQPRAKKPEAVPDALDPRPVDSLPAAMVDRTAKLYIGGKQARPDSGYSYQVLGPQIRRWPCGDGQSQGYPQCRRSRAQSGRLGRADGPQPRAGAVLSGGKPVGVRMEFIERLKSFGQTQTAAKAEVETSIRRIFWYAAQSDKFDGAVHRTEIGACHARDE